MLPFWKSGTKTTRGGQRAARRAPDAAIGCACCTGPRRAHAAPQVSAAVARAARRPGTVSHRSSPPKFAADGCVAERRARGS